MGQCTARKCWLLPAFALLIAGIGVTVWGYTHKSFWEEHGASWCTSCNEDIRETRQATDRAKVAGPIVLGLSGLMFIIAGICIWTEKESPGFQSGVVMAPYSSPAVASTTTGGTTNPSYPKPQSDFTTGNQTYPPQQHGGYPPTPGYPPAQGYPSAQGYPPAQGYPSGGVQGYPPPQQNYPPPQQSYTPPQQNYPPPTQNYPPPPSYESNFSEASLPPKL